VAAWRAPDDEQPGADALCSVLVDLAAVSLERAQLGRIRSRAEADRQAATLRDATERAEATDRDRLERIAQLTAGRKCRVCREVFEIANQGGNR
jgi:hypothetical protein